MVLLDSTKYNADAANVIGGIHAIMERSKAEILASRPWDERRLAYPVEGQKKGTYFLIYFRADGTALKPIEDAFRLYEPILRTLVLKIHPKLVETMLTMARDEHALAVQAPGLAEETDAIGAGGGRRDR
jgi:small subunit ribosomal protein S6